MRGQVLVLVLVLALVFVGGACGSGDSGPGDAGAPSSEDVSIAPLMEIDMQAPLADLPLAHQRRICVVELEQADLCREAAVTRGDPQACRAFLAECEIAPLAPREYCRDPGFGWLDCAGSVEAYLACARARTEALSCDQVDRERETAPSGCEAFLADCPDAHGRFGYFNPNDGFPRDDDISWQPDDQIPIDDEVPAELTLEEPERGFQLQTGGVMIGAAADEEYFEVLQLPGTPDTEYFVTRMEIEMTTGSHHVVLSAIRPGTTAAERLTAGQRGPGLGSELPNGSGAQPVVEGLGGSQSPYSDRTYPEGLGRVLYGGQKLIIDYHYFNPSDTPIPAKQRVNFHTSDSTGTVVKHFQWTHVGIEIPPAGTAVTQGTCRFAQEVRVLGLSRHTHALGTDFHVYHVGGERDGERIYTSVDWEHDTDYRFEGKGFLVAPGEGFRFECHYENASDRRVTFGEMATDEMCILSGTYYRTDEQLPEGEDCLLF